MGWPMSSWPRAPGCGPSRRHGRHAVQRVGLVRYNPFEDTGGNQSFALALLDADANGVVLVEPAFPTGDPGLSAHHRGRPV